MTAITAPLHTRLRALDADRANRQTRLIAALNARRIGNETLAARVAFARDRRAAGAWIRFRAGEEAVFIAPLLVDGELVRLSGGDGAADPALAARLLPAIEPLVVALETALTADFHPDGIAREIPDDLILLRLDASCPRHTIRHRLLIAVSPDGTISPSALPTAAPALLSSLRPRWSGAIDAPAIPAARLGTVSIGDLLLLGIGPLDARITIPGRGHPVAGRIEPSKGQMTLQDDLAPEPAEPAANSHATAPVDPPADWEAMKVPTTIEVEGGLLSARDIAGLAAGSVLPLPHDGGTLSVRVIAGGATIGSGELVAIGEGYGVLFTGIAAAGN